MLSASRWNRGKKFTGCNRPIRRRVTKLHDWFALVNKYFRGKIMWTSLPLTEIWPISDRFIKQKYYCITVHYRTVCTSENHLGQTVQTGQQTLGHLELFSDYVRWPTPNWIPASSRTQHSDASEARTHSPSVSGQALYHWATVLPLNAGENYYRML